MTSTHKSLLFHVLDVLECPALEVDTDGNVESVNQTMTQLLGEGRGMKCHEYLMQASRPCAWCSRGEPAPDGAHREIYLNKLDRIYDLTRVPLIFDDGTRSMFCILEEMTAHRQTERRLRNLEQDYSLLFEHVGSGVFLMNRQGKLTGVNQAILDMLGYKGREELLGKEVGKHLFRRLEDYDLVRRLVHRRGVIVDRELDMRQKNGKPLSVLLTVHPRYNMDGTVVGYEGIVSRRKKLLKEVQEAHDFLRSIIQNSPNAIVGTDLDGQIILWNRGAEEILGYRAKDVIGKMNMSALYPEGKGEETLDFLRREGGRLTGYPTIYVRQNGEGVEGSLSTSIVADASGKEVAIVGIFVDLKERIEMERKLRQTQDQLLQSEKLASLGKLSATIAHEINNPLAAVLTYIRLLAKLMARGQLTPERMGDVQKYLGIMESETARCGEIVKNLLAFSRQSSVRMGPCRVEDILERTILLVAHDLDMKGIRLVREIQTNVPTLHCDPRQIQQAILNLLSNASEAMMAGGGVISVRAARSEDGRTIEIAISDTGCGISEEDLKTIFEPFFTTKGEGKGVGLGLSIAYGIITRHQGSIDVASEPGRGSTFTIRLPAA